MWVVLRWGFLRLEREHGGRLRALCGLGTRRFGRFCWEGGRALCWRFGAAVARIGVRFSVRDMCGRGRCLSSVSWRTGTFGLDGAVERLVVSGDISTSVTYRYELLLRFAQGAQLHDYAPCRSIHHSIPILGPIARVWIHSRRSMPPKSSRHATHHTYRTCSLLRVLSVGTSYKPI